MHRAGHLSRDWLWWNRSNWVLHASDGRRIEVGMYWLFPFWRNHKFEICNFEHWPKSDLNPTFIHRDRKLKLVLELWFSCTRGVRQVPSLSDRIVKNWKKNKIGRWFLVFGIHQRGRTLVLDDTRQGAPKTASTKDKNLHTIPIKGARSS